MSDYDMLEDGLGDASQVTGEFARHLGTLRSAASGAGGEVEGLSRGLSKGLRGAFDGVAKDGDRLSDALRGVGRTLVDTVYAAAMKPVTDGLGGAVSQGVAALLGGAQPFARGGAFVQGRVTPFAKGGVGGRADHVPDEGRHRADGRGGAGGHHAAGARRRRAPGRARRGAARGLGDDQRLHARRRGFRRSRSQIAAEMSRALGRGARNR